MTIDNSKKPNYFVRVLLILLIIFLIVMIGYKYYCIQPIGDINSGILILLAFVIVLVLAESFDNFSIGKILSISREVKKKQIENESLEKKNSELINKIISISNQQNQNQQHTNVYGDYYLDSSKTAQATDSNNSTKVKELLDTISKTIVIDELEKSIKHELTEKGLNIDGDTNTVLIRHLAGTQLLLAFERIDSLIFGSQLRLLKILNSVSGVGKPEQFVIEYFAKVKSDFGDAFKEWDLTRYLEFMFARLLITTDDNNNLHITNLGVEYLTWLTRNGINENKPL